jgi:hypothetical protein
VIPSPCDIRTIDDAHALLRIGYDVTLEVESRKRKINQEFRAIFYGAPNRYEAFKTEIKKFRETNRPYRNVRWYRIRRTGGETMQDFRGRTGIINNADDQGVSISYTGGGVNSLMWKGFWKNWTPVSLEEVNDYLLLRFKIVSISSLDAISAKDLLIDARNGNRTAQAAWDIWQRQRFYGSEVRSWDKITVEDWEKAAPYREQRKQKVKELIDRAIR